jgi:hypothetical protein
MSLHTVTILLLLFIILNKADNAKRYSDITASTLDAYRNINSNLSNDCHDIWPEIELFLPIHIAPRGHRNLGTYFAITIL